MKVRLWPTAEDSPPQLYFEPQSAGDEKILARLLADYKVLGFGRHPETWKIIHLQLLLESKDAHE